MKCIDAVEGTVKNILKQIRTVCSQDRLDDTEYIRMVKAIIDATDQFVGDNPELVDDPQLLKRVLYDHSRNLWMVNQERPDAPSEDKSEVEASEDKEYQTYYYDYLYHRGLYPR